MKYDLARMLKEIREDEKQRKTGAQQKLSQDQIRQLRKDKQKPQ